MNRPPTRFILLAVFSVMGCHHEHQEYREQGKFLVTSPLRKDAELTRDYVAQIRAIQHIELRALEKGYLQGTFIDEGQQVEKGARMFQIMPMIYQAETQKANAEAELSAIELKNTKLLADKNVVSPNELALARAKFSKARAEVALAATHQSMTEIRAPFDGLVGRFQVRMGSLVDEGDLLTTLSDNSKVWVYFNVSEVEYLQYESRSETEKTTTVKLQMADGQIFEQTGTVETIEADFNNATGNLAFRATFPNPKGLLRHGETGKILMEVPLRNALLIPQKATFDVLDKKFVFVIDEKNVVHSRPITIAAEMPQVFAVADGLEEHDKILVEGLRKVRDGVKIEVDYKDPADVLTHLEVPAE
ncbi:efflux RND transporter periplasmic adaptor subunit [Polyangium sp. y55x31]|uniref:efflux RND transporter periplasmic adaptor subunit n=1 Tax=Polyangium sp. y55x31 TaxID=3042688 RepID=UPI0024826454|nr:efflux RND transporter periplasmic adaptor subunit [Polyangium sp. y55x31]MDI1480841.1 efflux RND transporter periplasmic adaptor subunit [Polyangium sp. y55x31]